ncbi:MAG: NAD(P)-dependent oxidoreductase [Propionibacteriales bacterium]|nr:NAD(P)-dependent oxidoreductase [Propionibacteriales bacterium]
MAARLLAAGHELTVWNRTAEAATELVAAGAFLAASPAAAADGADVAIVMVSDDDASGAVWLGPDGLLAGKAKAGAFAVECSTLSRRWVGELSGVSSAAGWRYLDCPVTGLPDAAADGQLTLLVGAASDDLAEVRPVLAAFSAEIRHFGPVGAGTAYKLIVNLIGAVQIAGVAEGLAMAQRAGLNLAQVAEALASGQAASPQVVRNVARMVADDHYGPVTFSGRLRRKDAAYALALAEELGMAAPFGEVAVSTLDDLLAAGLGEANESAVIEVARSRSREQL